MNIATPNKHKDLLIRKLQGLVWRLENTGNGDFTKNGELVFAKEIGTHFANKPFVFFDIGANVGEYTEMILEHIQTKETEMHLFEPQKTCFQTLQKKFSDVPTIHLNNFGLSNTTEEATLYKDHDQSGLASVHKRNLSHYNMEMNESESISLRKASTYIEEKKVKKIDLIKIDIEGHELEALAGFGDFLTPENVSFIQFEYGGANLDSQTSLLDLFTFFEKHGFALCKMMKNGLEVQKYTPRFENFMYQNWVAVDPALI